MKYVNRTANGVIEIREDSLETIPIGAKQLTDEQFNAIARAETKQEIDAILFAIQY